MATDHMTSKHSEPDPPANRRGWRRRGKTVLRWCLAILLVLVLLQVGISIWSQIAVKRAEQRVIDSGESLEFRDFLPPEIPALENASFHLEAASRLCSRYRHEPFTSTDLDTGQPTLLAELSRVLGIILEGQHKPDENDLALIRGSVERFDTVYRILDEARPLERARFDTSYSDDLAMEYEIPNLLARLNMARLLSARAILAIYEERPDDAYRDAASLFRFASWVDQETPALIGKMIAAAISQIGCSTVNQLVQFAPPGQDQMQLISEEAGRLEPASIFRQALLSERATNFSTLIDADLTWRSLGFQFSDGSPLNDILTMSNFVFHPYARLAAAAQCDGMTRVMQDSEPPAWQRDPDPEDEEFDRRYSSGVLSLPAGGMVPNCFRVSNRRDILLARLDLLALAFRLEECHRENGAYPDRLDLLEGPQPVDPFSGQAYRYRTENSGYLLYSVAGNRVDDGGSPMPKPWKNREGDLVWRIR